MSDLPDGIRIADRAVDHAGQVLTSEALAFVAQLHRSFDTRRRELLAARVDRQAEFDAGALPDFLQETAHVRDDETW